MVTPGRDAESKVAELLRETKAAREAAAPLWPDTDARLARLEVALEAQQERESK